MIRRTLLALGVVAGVGTASFGQHEPWWLGGPQPARIDPRDPGPYFGYACILYRYDAPTSYPPTDGWQSIRGSFVDQPTRLADLLPSGANEPPDAAPSIAHPTPEPSTFLLAALAGIGLLAFRRRSRQTSR